MKSIVPTTEDRRPYLEVSDIIDWQQEEIAAAVKSISAGSNDVGDEARARRLFHWVRDRIEHSIDFHRTELTCRASDVLSIGTGFCYSKSHLLAALLRASGIPAGFCYQRLSIDGHGPPFCLHGLNAVYLNRHGWFRVDARGNTDTVHAAFSPPDERLAFEPRLPGEADLPGILPTPLPCIVQALTSFGSVEQLARNLPDLTLQEWTNG